MVTVINSDDSEDEAEHLQYKVILLGDGAVGKTSLATRFTGDHSSSSYKQTIGVDFFLKQMVLPSDFLVTLQLWDIGGQTIGGKMVGNYIYGAQAILLVYDITNYQSFVNLEEWLWLVKQTFGPTQMPYMTLVGNKMDLKHLQAVSQRRHRAFADRHVMQSCFVSAKTGESVVPCFLRLSADLAGVVLTQDDLDAAAGTDSQEAANPLADLPLPSHGRRTEPAVAGAGSRQPKAAYAEPPEAQEGPGHEAEGAREAPPARRPVCAGGCPWKCRIM